MSTELSFCCPLCQGSLARGPMEYACAPCQRTYPIVLGIPDFRVFPDPYIDYVNDRRKAQLIGEQSGLDFRGLLEFYWKITPDVPPKLAGRYIKGALTGVAKALSSLHEIERVSQGDRRDDAMLEVGCGTGGFLVAAKPRYRFVIGIDIALRWLIIAKRRFEELNMEIPLLCCCAEFLPFSGDSFDLVVANAVIEHTKDQERVLSEAFRVLKDRGMLFLTTANRYSLAPEPHVRVWGVGFFPRRAMARYVRLIRGVPYRHIRLLSAFELRGMLKRSRFQDDRILLPDIGAAQLASFSSWERFQVRCYRLLKGIPLVKALLYVFGPLFHIACYKGFVGATGRSPLRQDLHL